MNADPKAVQELFAQAIAITDIAEREKFLADQCAGNFGLYERVVKLIAAYDGRKGFLDNPTHAMDATQANSGSSQQPGSVIAGRYKLLEAIGEGGMGTVWVAEQTQPVRRKVALKLVKPGMDSKQVLARFDAERQALALMDHPNIAKVFDGGVTDEGRPFFAMEYVKGMPLTEYCDQVRLSLEERLRLFVPICQAVQHAHQKGIIHRDLKPSNVLICLYDGKPVPKVIDFGLAKAMFQPLTEQTLHTGHGLMLGTPLYMSPEQAEHNNLDVDTRTDVYSLGVMLYELLTGTTPLEKAQLKDALFGEILRLIKEVEPPKPSTRVSTNALRASIAAQRSLEPEQLGRSIRGDLDWIVMKALDKERDRRYETANGLARDLERFLNQEAVEACPPSTVYRLKKQFQKHRAAISTAAAFLLLLCIGAGISTWQAYRATIAEATTREQRDKAIQNERQALDAKSAESTARIAEEQARADESQQRGVAETQRAEAEKQRDEAQRLQQEAIARSAQLEKLSEEQRRVIYASDMNLVRLESQRGNLPRMREILHAQLPIEQADLRGFEWHYWYRYLTQAEVLRHFDAFRGEKDASQPVILPGGKLTAVPKGLETTLVDLQTGELLATIPRAIGKLVNRARFAENGRSVFGECNSQKAFGPSVPTQLGKLEPPQGEVLPSGFTVFEPGQETRNFDYPSDAFSHISFLNISEDGRFVGALGNDKNHRHADPACRLIVWNVETQDIVLDHLEKRRLNRFAFNRDGSRVAAHFCHGPVSYSNDQRDVVVAIDVTEKRVLGVAQRDDDIDTAIWLPGNDRLILTTLGFSGRQQKELLTWDLISGQLQPISGELIPNYAIVCESPAEKLLAVGSPSTSSIRLIDLMTGSVRQTLHNEATAMESFQFSRDGSRLVAFCASGDVVQWPVSMDEDRFALRSRPLPSGAGSALVHWEFSDNRELLAYNIQQNGFLTVRNAGGDELYLRNAQATLALDGRGKLRFNREGDLLAVVSRLDNQFCNIELIDLRASKVRWTSRLEEANLNFLSMEFTSDRSSLIVTSQRGIFGFDLQSGQKRETPRLPNQLSYVRSELRRWGDSGNLSAVGLSVTETNNQIDFSMVVQDAVTGELIDSISIISDTPGYSTYQPVRVAPNGQKVVRFRNPTIELWDLPRKQLVFKTNGSSAFFSHDSRWLVISRAATAKTGTSVPATTSTWNVPVDSVQIVSAEDGRLIAEFSMAGDDADEIRMSPDNRRLLTLHGKQPNGTRSRPAHARLWDCESWREILDLPVAPDCLYYWDLDFDPSGHSLRGSILTKAASSGSVGRSLLFDATPLSPQEDAHLVATNWVQRLTQETPVPQQMIEAIHRNTSCQPLVRDTALAIVGRIPFDSQAIADRCLQVIEQPELELPSYERARSWGEALAQTEPGSLRAIALVGAAQLRLGQIDDALATLSQREPLQFAADNNDFPWERLRRSMEILCLHRQGKDLLETHRRAIALADYVHEAYAADAKATTITWPSFPIREALLTQGGPFHVSQTKGRIRPALDAAKLAAQQSATRVDPLKESQKAFRRLDVDQDGNLSPSEVPQSKFLEQSARFDKDGVAGLSLNEFSTILLIVKAQEEAHKSIHDTHRVEISKEFSSVDKNKDGSVTSDDSGAAAWTQLKQWDKDQDNALNLEEYQQFKFQSAFVRSLMMMITKFHSSDSAIQLLAVNAALEDHPGEMNLLNARAWILATSDDDKIRNGKQAVQDATQACELWNYRVPGNIDTLAAAFAEIGDFEKAVEYAEKAVAMIGATSKQSREIKTRLELYKQKRPFRQQAAEELTKEVTANTAERPLYSTAQIQQARRIPGGEPCWSADGKRLIYSLTGFGPEHSYLESLDLTTGEKKGLCRGGQQLVCSPVDETLAFFRSINSEPTEIWLYDPVSNKERKLTDGFRPQWTSDGKLCYFPMGSGELVCITPDQLDRPLWTRAVASSPYLSALSPDGKRYGRVSFGKWTFFDLEETVEVPRVAYSTVDQGRADWSPDGRFIAYGAKIENIYGVWLIDPTTQETHLLAELAAYPRWSPDGKTLALGLRSSNEILLLDVSSLSSILKGMPDAQPNQP